MALAVDAARGSRRPAELTPATTMPRTCIDTADAIELAETLQLIAHCQVRNGRMEVGVSGAGTRR